MAIMPPMTWMWANAHYMHGTIARRKCSINYTKPPVQYTYKRPPPHAIRRHFTLSVAGDNASRNIDLNTSKLYNHQSTNPFSHLTSSCRIGSSNKRGPRALYLMYVGTYICLWECSLCAQHSRTHSSRIMSTEACVCVCARYNIRCQLYITVMQLMWMRNICV